jgi:DNA-binding XRE family transcriptional regulator
MFMLPPDRKTPHSRKTPELIEHLRKHRLTGGLVGPVASNKMAVSRWGRGAQALTDEQTDALYSYCLTNRRATAAAVTGPIKEWREHISAGSSLRDERMRAGLKQPDVATAIGVSRATYIAAEKAQKGQRMRVRVVDVAACWQRVTVTISVAACPARLDFR